MHEDANTPAYANQPCSWRNRAVENSVDDGSSSTGYALSHTPINYYHWLGAEGANCPKPFSYPNRIRDPFDQGSWIVL